MKWETKPVLANTAAILAWPCELTSARTPSPLGRRPSQPIDVLLAFPVSPPFPFIPPSVCIQDTPSHPQDGVRIHRAVSCRIVLLSSRIVREASGTHMRAPSCSDRGLIPDMVLVSERHPCMRSRE